MPSLTHICKSCGKCFSDILLFMSERQKPEKLFPITYSFAAYNSIRRQLYFAKMFHVEMHFGDIKSMWGGENIGENAKILSRRKTQSNILRNCIYVAPISLRRRRRHKFNFEGLVAFLHAIWLEAPEISKNANEKSNAIEKKAKAGFSWLFG